MTAMNDTECIELAERYLSSQSIGYRVPGLIGSKEETHWKVIFAAPGTEDPLSQLWIHPTFGFW